MTDTWLQVASLNREVVALRESVQAKDVELASASAAGSSELEHLRSARQELADNMAAAQEQLQVIIAHESKRHSLGIGKKPSTSCRMNCTLQPSYSLL